MTGERAGGDRPAEERAVPGAEWSGAIGRLRARRARIREEIVQTGAAQRLSAAFAREGARNRALQLFGRSLVLLAAAGLVMIVAPFPASLYYLGFVLLLGAAGVLQLGVERRAAARGAVLAWIPYLFATFDFLILSIGLVTPNPLVAQDLPPQLLIRVGNVIYFFPLIISLGFSLDPRLALWGGVSSALCWAGAVLTIAALPETVLDHNIGRDIAVIADPHFVDLGVLLQECVLFVVTGALVALVVERTRLLAQRQSALERERGNLARYFSPAVVDRLAEKDGALDDLGERRVAVMFTDLVGFTTWAERQSPSDALALLRGVHEHVEEAVFAHDGALDKFIGDGAMATFGSPNPGPSDAANALACVLDLLDRMAAWNAERADAGLAPIRLSIGLHLGQVVIGDIGTARRMELAVLGDTVNVASRLEHLTREIGCRAVISAEAYRAALETASSELRGRIETRAAPAGERAVQGRREPLSLFRID